MAELTYRLLEPAELEHLEKDFIQFLAANSILADDWEEMKKDEEKAGEMITLFSNVVWDKILENIKFVEHRFPTEMRVYKFNEDKAELIVLKLPEGDTDLTNPEHISAIAQGEINLADLGPEIFRGSKKYESDKKQEVFDLMEAGARPCKEVFWRSVEKMVGG